MTTDATLDAEPAQARTPQRHAARSRRALRFFLLLVLFTAGLACVNWDAIRTVNHESSDFAANTLLVLDAKRFQLIQGHYSRVGFNHPGPALLYVLAFGELLFHDWLHLVPSPFSGQLLAVDVYDAAWLAAIVAMVRRMSGHLSGRMVPALLFTAVMLLVLAWSDRAIVGGIWFPHLFVLPYAALLVAGARLVQGRIDTLGTLAVAAGFLFNGHAAFMPILGLTLLMTLAANRVLARREPELRIVGRLWLATHRRALLLPAGILFLFFVPLIIATVREFPGPLYDYLKFGRANKANTLVEAARFVGVYWGLGDGAPARGALAWGLALAALLLAGLGRVPPAFARDARALGIVFLVATLSVLYYAWAGVDMLGQVYIAAFYFAVPALAAGLLALIGYASIRIRAREAMAAMLALLAVAGAWHWLRVPPDYAYFYNHANVAALYEQVRRLPGHGRVVLDLDLGPNPTTQGEVWGNTMGLLAYAARQGVDLACVNENWHISFTRPRRCRPEEVAAGRRYQVRHTDAPNPVRGEPDAEAQGLSLFRAGAPPRPVAWNTVGAQPAWFRQILGEGWSAIEGDSVWSDGPLAVLRLPADPQRGRMLTLDLGSFVPGYGARIRLQAVVNGRAAGSWTFYPTERRRRVTLDLGPAPGAAQHIVLTIDQPLRPVDYGIGQDTRRLGISLYGIRK
ncbi:hypothetical protein [Herbaspirillum sp. SJZ107]|uniref:hypothetical protein n=1 Tax=Herbaspirillum sp. SJZ107 TaxID=2572881 RepID=UPI001154B53D|nr:hypothetical protein [Herbaspirillum sp. SJZ107]TQK02539.1 hypothetical protein FBX97_5189 [Herbaspirillum sp. SJZ107]